MEIWKNVKDTGWKVSATGKVMKPNGHIINFRSRGYRECELGMVHRIVAYYFCNPPCEANKRWVCEGYEVHHKNRIPSDNRADNLVYVTHDEHKRIHQTKYQRRNENVNNIIDRTLVLNFLNSLRG